MRSMRPFIEIPAADGTAEAIEANPGIPAAGRIDSVEATATGVSAGATPAFGPPRSAEAGASAATGAGRVVRGGELCTLRVAQLHQVDCQRLQRAHRDVVQQHRCRRRRRCQ